MRNLVSCRLATLLIAATLLLSACATGQDYSGVVGEFRNSVDASTAALRGYYLDMNAYERDIYLEQRLYDNSLQLQKTDAAGQPTPLFAPVFSPDAIQARLDALSVLGVYGSRLAELAGSDAPEQLPGAVSGLGEELATLGARFEKLAGAGDSGASAYVAPVSAIIGAIGESYLEAKREAFLRDAVSSGSKQVNQILDLLQRDFTQILGPQRITGIELLVADAIGAYNAERATLDFAERNLALDKIASMIARQEVIRNENPVALITAMREAHDALVSFVASDRDELDIGRLRTRIEHYAARVKTIVKQIDRLRKAA